MRALALTVLALLAPCALAPAAEAAYPGANGRLVFFQEEIGGTDPVGLAVADADGRNQTGDEFGPRCRGEGLTAPPMPCPVDPQWSPDGRLIAFGLGDAVGVIRPDGSGLRRIRFDSLTAITSPSWSPDGNRLTFSARDPRPGGGRSLYLARADGTGLRRLTLRGEAGLPAWSARNEIAFVRARNIEVLKPDAILAGARKATSRGGTRPTWSPSGLTIAFVRRVRLTRRARTTTPVLYRVTGRGRKLRRLTRLRAEDPSWTPDGREVLFVRSDSGANIFIHAVDAGGRRSRVVTGGFEGRRSAATQPDQQPLPR